MLKASSARNLVNVLEMKVLFCYEYTCKRCAIKIIILFVLFADF